MYKNNKVMAAFQMKEVIDENYQNIVWYLKRDVKWSE